MDGKHGRDVADNKPWRCQASFNTNHIPSQSGEALTEESYGERWAGDFPSAGPPSLHHKEPVTVMHRVLSEGAPSSSSSSSSSCTHTASISMSRCNSVNELLSAAHQQDLKRDDSSTWSSVIKESLEISNGMEVEVEVEQGLLADMYGSPLIYDSRAEELAKNHFDPEDNETDVQERRRVTEEPTLLNLSFKARPLDPNQELRHETEAVMYSSSLDDEDLCETRCGTRKRCSSLGLYDAAEVCALENSKVSPFTKRRCFSEDGGAVVSNQRSASLTQHVSVTGNETVPVLKQALQHSSAREHAPSHINTGKCIANQTKSTTPHRHLNTPGHRLRFDIISAEPTYSSTSERKDDLGHDLPEENPPTLNTMKHFRAPVEISRTLGESDEANSPSETEESTRNGSEAGDPDVATTGAQSSCKLLRRRENAELLVDDVLTCSRSHSSDATSSLNANHTSQMMINTDQETENVQVITEDIKVGTLSETGGNCVYSPHPPRAEARPSHEPQLHLHRQSSDVILSNGRSPVRTKKSSLKTVQEPDVAAHPEKSSRNLKIHPENQDSVSGSTSNTFHTDQSNKLQKTPESQRKEATVTESRKHTMWRKSRREKSRGSEVNGAAGFESSAELRSCFIGAFNKTVKKEMLKTVTDASLRVSDKHADLLEQNIHDKNSHRGSNTVSLKTSPVHRVDQRFTQHCADAHVTTLKINTHTCSVADQVKGAETSKHYIRCKFCRRSFRHLSAYTLHQRIHTGEKPYRCELCGKNFAQLSKLKAHRNVHVQSASLLCPCCRRTFAEQRDLIAHFTSHVKEQKNVPGQNHKPDAPLKNPTRSPSVRVQDIPEPEQDKLVSCKTCGKEFQTSLQLADHEKTHWPVKPYACSVCARSFTRIKALKKHSAEHTGETPFSCSQCDSAFCDLPGLRAHQTSKPCSLSLNRENRDIEGFLVTHGVDGQVHTPVFFRCHICRQLYRKWCQYTLHLQTHTSAPPYLCFACGQSYSKDFEISLHCRICCQTSGEEAACGSSLSEIFQPRKDSSLTGRPPTADTSKSKNLSKVQTDQLIPVKSFRSVTISNDDGLPPSPTTSLNESVGRVEQPPRIWRFECPRCGQRYKRHRSLRIHMQTHAAAFRYSCGRCGCSFKRWSQLWLHQRRHRRKARRYVCSQCNIQFLHYSSYKMHLLKHAEERPSTCPLYPQTFVHVHQCDIQQPAGTVQPEGCTRGFSNLTNLVKHGLLHDGAITQQCLLCNLPFANSRSLQEHLNVHHNGVSLLPSIPAEPLRFLHKCNRCKSSFSTGDLLYAHQICHTRDLKHQVRSTQSSESTSVRLEGTRQVSSASRCLLSSLDLDAVPNESLYKYPHPDELYVPSRVSRMSKRLPVINLDTCDEDQEATTDPVWPKTGPSKKQKLPESSQTDTTRQPQVLERRESAQTKANGAGPTRTHEHAETSVYLEGPATTVNPAENEMFECADCSEHVGSLIALYEHYFLHALGNAHLYTSL